MALFRVHRADERTARASQQYDLVLHIPSDVEEGIAQLPMEAARAGAPERLAAAGMKRDLQYAVGAFEPYLFVAVRIIGEFHRHLPGLRAACLSGLPLRSNLLVPGTRGE